MFCLYVFEEFIGFIVGFVCFSFFKRSLHVIFFDYRVCFVLFCFC